MGLQELLDKYDKDMRTGDNWFTLKKKKKIRLVRAVCLIQTILSIV